MAKEFKLPDIGEGLTEGEIVKWFVEEGDQVKENDTLVEVMTEKVNVEIPSPYTGTVLKILAEEGKVVNVGQPIIVVGEKGEKAEEKEAEEEASEDGGAKEEVEESAPERAPPEEKPKPTEETILAAPAVRRLARELEVDLSQVQGSGPRGRITAGDVRKFAESPEVAAKAEPEVEVTVEEETRAEVKSKAEELSAAKVPEREGLVDHIPIRGIRRTISERMLRSKTTAAHFTYVEETDVTELVSLREKAKGWAESKGVKLTYLPFILKAVTATLKEHPSLNATVDWEREEVLQKRYYNIGIATATDEGLMVAVVKDVGEKSILELAREIEALSEKARKGELSLDEVRDSTFTITSLGLHGGVLATPIINPPEVAILGIHKIAKRPVVRDGQIVVRDMMNVSLSFDHRIIDGHVGAAFTQTLVQYLEDPGLLLLNVLESGD